MKHLRTTLLLTAALAWAGCSGNDPVGFESTPLAKNGDAIPGAYIVTLSADVPSNEIDDVAESLGRKHNGAVGHVYQKAIRGFSMSMSDKDMRKLQDDDRVVSIEPDRYVSLGKPSKPGGGGGTTLPAQTTPWGITAVGGPGPTSDKTVFILDTGIDLDHPELNVDLTRSATFAGGKSADDGNGHGTHCAGIVGAKNNTIGVVGVAPGVTLVAVKVLGNNGSGSYSGIIAGLNHVLAKGTPGDIVNMSLGGPGSTALDNAVLSLANAGYHVVVAAGNAGVDASVDSPGRLGNNHALVYTISAHDPAGCLTSWSNYGLDCDFAAPGLNILSTYKGGTLATISGTSMAAPHVAGILATGGTVLSVGVACSDSDGVPDPLAHR